MRKMRLINRYSTDGANRLVIKQGKRSLTADGRFVLERNNRLAYYLNEPALDRGIPGLPSHILFDGNWLIDAGHNLVFKLIKNKEQSGRDALILKGEIISFEGNDIAFELKTVDSRGNAHMQILRFTGTWKADEYNRISFLLKREKTPDILTFRGSWELNQNQQITYQYEITQLRRKTKLARTLVFDGFWQVNAQNRLRYILTRGIDSFFDFRIQSESPTLYPKNNQIKYRIGIGVKARKPAYERTIVLYGTWKFSRKAGVSFEMDYGRGIIHKMEFGVTVNANKKDTIVFSLLNARKEPLGLCLEVTHRFLKEHNAEAFLRLKQKDGNPEVDAGVRMRF